MMSRDIDKIVKDALSNMEAPYNSRGWDMIERRMDAAEAEDFDNEVRQSVSDASTSYQHAHWLQLKSWLDYSWYTVNKIYVSKLIECALMMLVLFTFHHAGIDQKIQASNSHDKIKAVGPVAIINHVVQYDNPVLAYNSKLVSPSSTSNAELRSNDDDNVAQTGRGEIWNEQSLTESKYRDIESKLNSTVSINSGDPELNNTSAVKIDPLVLAEPEIHSNTSHSIQSIGLLDIHSLIFNGQKSFSAPQLTLPAGNRNWYISAFSAIDFNHVRTPYDQQFKKDGYNQNRIGMGGGLMVHHDFKKFELSLGGYYSSKQYSPKEFVELFRRTPESQGTAYTFEGIRLNLLSIPVNTSYTITDGKWRTYALGGGALHLALQAQYDKEAEPIALAGPAPIGALETVGTQPQFEQKKFPDGILEEGPFNENHYFTLNLGLGVERRISPQTSIFAQPTMYYNLFSKGISANNDRINTFSLQLGVKSKL